MIYIVDNFLDKKLLNTLQQKFLFDFEKIVKPSCTLYAKKAPEEFTKYLENKISAFEGRKIKSCMCGFRYSDSIKDDHWRIHADLYLDESQKCMPERAGVIYMTDPPEGLTGTAFWELKENGLDYIDLEDTEAHNKSINESNDESKWTLKSVIGHKKNRFLSYPCSYYHSKYPNKTNESRIVCVIFYSYD